MGRVENQEFLEKVEALLTTANTEQSSLHFTQKRYVPYDEVTGKDSVALSVNDTTLVKDLPIPLRKDTKKYAILMRVTNGSKDKSKKLKYLTVVESDKLEQFWKDYGAVFKNGIGGLKKKSKKKKGKKK